ncbi:DNA polymerase III subunits gamma and tau [invertebrate metagenome]|uniref:DNA-directed DNA polymerase n=1 Tax=invertebrate metagenome TaxID=1711999 RepID=A0A484H8T9_9ZZZZ
MVDSDFSSDIVTAAPKAYRVLARKYRPTTFAELVGQDVLVRILTNTIRSGRIAHAYMLSGVRGVGKTTTARIFARALNCVGVDGTGGPTTQPCGKCEHCYAISADRHVDVLEMDAASRSSVNDIREVIESLRYRPARARYKVYIIDEVHMLSNQAFTALLKSLEEPPERVKFIFATTEIHKVPVTILSRCQRFDLRRVDIRTLTHHFSHVSESEGVTVEPEALRLIADAAGGSVRDGLSLLDQAMVSAVDCPSTSSSRTVVTTAGVREILGLANGTLIFDLLDALLRGEVRIALGLLTSQHESGADLSLMIQEMLGLIHRITQLKIVSHSSLQDPAMVEEESRCKAMAEKLSMAVLTRAWQMLLKAFGEVRTAPSPLQAAEMALIRIAYAANLPTPDKVVSALQKHNTMLSPSTEGNRPLGGSSVPSTRSTSSAEELCVTSQQMRISSSAAASPLAVAADPCSFAEVIALCQAQGEIQLAFDLQHQFHPVHFALGYIELRPTDDTQLAPRLARLLSGWTGRRWVVNTSHEQDEADEATVVQQGQDIEAQPVAEEVAAHPLVKAVLETFPGARISAAVAAAEPRRGQSARIVNTTVHDEAVNNIVLYDEEQDSMIEEKGDLL